MGKIELLPKNMARRRLGDFLRDARETLNLTQLYVAGKLGYGSAQFISNIERGISVIPIGTLKKMIKLYGLDTDEALDRFMESHSAAMILDGFSKAGIKLKKSYRIKN